MEGPPQRSGASVFSELLRIRPTHCGVPEVSTSVWRAHSPPLAHSFTSEVEAPGTDGRRLARTPHPGLSPVALQGPGAALPNPIAASPSPRAARATLEGAGLPIGRDSPPPSVQTPMGALELLFSFGRGSSTPSPRDQASARAVQRRARTHVAASANCIDSRGTAGQATEARPARTVAPVARRTARRGQGRPRVTPGPSRGRRAPR